MTERIVELLSRRNAVLKSSAEPDRHRGNVARMISKHYPVYDQFRRRLSNAGKGGGLEVASEEQHTLWHGLVAGGFAMEMAPGHYAPVPGERAINFLTGGWLEDLAYEAILEAGADAALARAILDWKIGGYEGQNEVDVLALKGDRLIFFSCKCASAWLAEDSARARLVQKDKLTGYMHEADNLADHFGSHGDAVVLLVTTDLIDESHHNRARLPSLFGKANALDVEIIGLDHLGWRPLVKRLQELLANTSVTGR
jgi:hypothetical protein